MEHSMSIKEMIGFSWNKAKEILFPFQFKKWLKIVIIVWLAGAGIQGFNFGGGNRGPATRQNQQITQPKSADTSSQLQKMNTATENAVTETSQAAASGVENGQASFPEAKKTIAKTPSANKKTDPRKMAPVIIAAVILGIILGLFFTWLSCRFSFILLDVLMTGKTMIRESFKEHRETGNSYFKWSLVFFGIPMILIGGGVLMMWFLKGNVTLSAILGVTGILLGLLLILPWILIAKTAQDFVLPIMYQEKILILAAWRRFLSAGSRIWVELIKYFLVLLGLGIVAGIVQIIVSIVVGIVGLIAGGICVIPGFLLAKAVPALAIPLIILGVLFFILLLLVIGILIGMIMLPVAIFFRVFALVFLTRLCPEYDLLGCSSGTLPEQLPG